MNKDWWIVLFAAFFEVLWVVGLKYADHILEWVLTVIAIIVSFGLLVSSGKKLPTSTVYAVFVGLGTVGTLLSEMIWFSVPFSWMKSALIIVLLVGIIGLKLVTGEEGLKGDEQR
jgi:paired small multidrug resistance pump